MRRKDLVLTRENLANRQFLIFIIREGSSIFYNFCPVSDDKTPLSPPNTFSNDKE